KGVAVDQKEKTAAGTLASLGNKAGAMRGGAGSSSALGSGFGALGGANFNAALSGDLNAKDGEMGDLNTGGAVAGATAGMGDGQGAAGAFGGLNAHGKGLVGGASSGGEYTDPTGMSDEEKDVLMANYERTKGRYQTEEGDGLFKI